MKRRGVVGASTLLAALGAAFGLPAWADFPEAYKAYSAGQYEDARRQFLALAELGDAASQFDLGAMAMQGQGGPKDLASAVGWLTAAADNGNRRLSAEKLAALRAQLSEEQRKAADRIAAQYGPAGLAQRVLPVPAQDSHCSNLTPAQISREPESSSDYYPASARKGDQDGFVILQLAVGVDGVPRDPEVLMSIPSQDFSAAAVDAWLTSRWMPARQSGVAVESKVAVKVNFNLVGSEVLWNAPALKQIRKTAAAGDPAAEYKIGLAATLDDSLGIPASEGHKLLVSAAQGGDPRAQYWAASRFMSFGACGTARKEIPWLQAAASEGDGAAQVALALRVLGGQPSAQQITEARSLLEQAARSDDFYAMKHVAALLAASPLAALRDPATAGAVAERLLKSPIESDPQMYEAVALAYAANGNYPEARAKQQLAIRKAQQLQWDTRQMQKRLAAYSASKPWIGDLFAEPSPGTAGSAAAPTTLARL